MNQAVPQPVSYIVIPARLASRRLPQKLLLRETGKSVLQHTYEAGKSAKKPAGICVATDSAEIEKEVSRFGGHVQLTSSSPQSGTDRVAEVANRMPDVDFVVNLQGDEPEISGQAIDTCVNLLEQNPASDVSTLATPIRDLDQLMDPACVKVIFDEQGQALYFSRSPIPYVRDGDVATALASSPPVFYLHIGLYAYRREFLLDLARLPRSRIEKLENLEQLRILSVGRRIQVGEIADRTNGIDTPEDYQAFVQRVRGRQSA